MNSRGSGMSRGQVNYGALDDRNQPASPAPRSNPFDSYDDDTRSVPVGGSSVATGSLMTQRAAIVDEIASINSCANALEKSLKIIQSNKDSPELRQKIHESELTTNKRIKHVAESLKKLSEQSTRANFNDRVMVQRLTDEFKTVTLRYNKLQKEIAEKVKQSAYRPVQPAAQSGPGNLVGWNDDDFHGSQQQQQQQMQFEEVSDLEQQLLQEREEGVLQLERDILDVNECFKHLNVLVHQQGEVVDTIEANVERAHSDVEQGVVQLQKASDYQTRARKKKCCLLICVLVTIIVIIVVIVIAVKTSK